MTYDVGNPALFEKETNFDEVGAFHSKFGLPVTGELFSTPQLINHETMLFRLRFLNEELHELTEAYAKQDLPGIADALVDLVYVAMGTAHYHRLPWQDLWDEVQRANMAKQRAQSEDESKRGSTLDVIKPAGWQPPNLERILEIHGWRRE